ncbi:hypothetical protein KDK77_01995 [bacterium]|nr:hypothetical protein [bacterium]
MGHCLRTKFQSVIPIVCILFLMMNTAGCAGKKKAAAASNQLRISDQITFSDLPVPYGFKLERSQSYAFKDGDSRIAMLKYTGRTKLDQVSGFYQNNMESYGWQALTLIDFEKTMQQFGKGQEVCTVTIERGNRPLLGIIPYSRTIITMQLTPSRSSSSAYSEYAPQQTQQAVQQPAQRNVERIPLSRLK